MGFLETAIGVAKVAGEAYQSKQEEILATREKVRKKAANMNDETLIRKYKSSSGLEKSAYAHVLAERGYGEIKYR